MKEEKKYQIVFHGTKKENVKSILKNGFKPETYFALNLSDALEFGGEYIFYVILKCGNENWQPRNKRKLSPKRITELIRVNPKIIYENDNAKNGYFPKGKKYPCPKCMADIGGVKLSIFGKPTNPKCPRCNTLFKNLFKRVNPISHLKELKEVTNK